MGRGKSDPTEIYPKGYAPPEWLHTTIQSDLPGRDLDNYAFDNLGQARMMTQAWI
jgi:hypothetical protein